MRIHFIYSAIIFLFGITAFYGCNELPDLDIEEPDALIVVDGSIESGRQAKVFLTTNTPYFTTIDSSSLRDLVLSRAKVTLSDGERSEVLILRKDLRFFPPFYYAGNTIFGEAGKRYSITAEFGGKSVEASTTIPGSVSIDTVVFEPIEGDEGLGQLKITFTDPLDQKNYYRLFTMRSGKDEKFISAFLMAINDQYFNGEQVSFFLNRPPDSFLSEEENAHFHVDDTIIVKLSTMDEASYNFWSSYQDEVINASNPFASSMVGLQSNIEGDGLGIWTGYGVGIDTLFGGKF